MVNFGLNTASFLGIILAIAGAGLYFLRSIRPELSRDQDIAFTAIGIICGFILIFQGWRLDPILQFGQLLLSGSAIYFAYESIKMRGILNEQAKEKSPIVDERPVSRRYKAEIEDREYLDDRPRNSRRIKGDSVATTARNESRRSDRRVDEDSDEQPRRRSATRQLTEDRYADESPRRRTTAARAEVSSLARRPNDDWDNEDDWNESDAPAPVRRALPDADLNADRSARRSNRRSAERTDPVEPTRDSPDEGLRQRDFAANPDATESQPRRRRPRAVGEASRGENRPQPTNDRDDTRQGEGTTANYVDYEPIDPPSGLPPSGAEPVVFPDRY
ncbi:Ycf66 family protein [Chamaesiphon sp. VAR_69_metabat_338]|uniref:Ycf66 family protein n=1 Tax=Chamaesiphon sp. VAR_69_metabat_338 TaxID=2964704 RepID=UPI00286DDC76|nr:Ycf66 family protein [Chamaesiphon sp. VAR_69_metabat_338]